ncbi:hypothetical protein BDZ45DRAFT_380389 [Acephala macrosclerotiorum]|nr:hypothetical protein BDZ45DRAFT_380389 [Acephala macrosclerotiorum]
MQVTAPTMEGHNTFPVPNATTPYWRSELHEIDSIRSTNCLPQSCECSSSAQVCRASRLHTTASTTTLHLRQL